MTLPRFPVTSETSAEERRIHGFALQILAQAVQHAPGYQLHRHQLKRDTGLSDRKFAAGLKFLAAGGYLVRVAVRNQAKLDGWCYRLDLNGKGESDPKGWVLHYNQTEDKDFQVRSYCRAAMRRRAARLPTKPRNKKAKPAAVASFEAPVRRAHKRPKLGQIPCTPYNGTTGTCGTSDVKRENPLTPCGAGGNSFFPPVSQKVWERSIGSQNRRTRLSEALGELSQKMSDHDITRWWAENIPGRMLDSTLPKGQSFTLAEKRVHVRRLRRDPSYLHCVTRHWMMTRLNVKRLDAAAVTASLKRSYDLRDTHDSFMDNYSLEQAYRRVRGDTGAEWLARKPTAHHHTCRLDTLGVHALPTDRECSAQLLRLDLFLAEVRSDLQEPELASASLFRYFALRMWIAENLAGLSDFWLDQMDAAGLAPQDHAMLAQWVVVYGPGRCLYERSNLDNQQRARVFGMETSDWTAYVGDHVVHLNLMEEQRRCSDWSLNRRYDRYVA